MDNSGWVTLLRIEIARREDVHRIAVEIAEHRVKELERTLAEVLKERGSSRSTAGWR